MNFMRKIIFISLCLFLYCNVYSQILKERRVYYLDCSYSMKQLGLWDPVRENLKNAIDNISDETTELLVIPFADNTNANATLKPIVAYADEEGKKKLKSKIDALPMTQQTMTYHNLPISDFYDKRIDGNKVTYMFFMTDGCDEDKQQRAINTLWPQWEKRFGNKNVFGFYVMLHGAAKNPKLEQTIKNQNHLWKVESADVNINLVRAQSNAIFNAKNDEYINLPLYGNVDNLDFKASFASSCPYKVKSVYKIGKNLRVWIDCPNKTGLPISSNNQLNISVSGCGDYDFLVTDKVDVKCEFKPERSLKIIVK